MVSDMVLKVKPSATLEITAKAKAMKAEGIDVVGLGGGEPDFDTPEHIKNALYEAVEEGFIYYTPTRGIIELRKAVAKKLENDNKISYDPEKEVLVTPGAKQALYEAILAITNPGDEILLPDPYWVSYEPMIQMAGGVPVFVPTSEEKGFKLEPDQIKERVTKNTKAIILNSPNNPTGAVLNGYDMREISKICIENDLIAVSDEIYEGIIYDGKHISMAALSGMKKRTVTINGFSKAYSMTGWRLGYAAAPAEIIDGMNRIQEHSVSCPTSFVQKAGIAALTESQDCVKEMTKEFRKRRNTLIKMLGEIDGVSCVMPSGTFYAFANFSCYEKDSFKFASFLLDDARVAAIPGRAFGNEGEGFIRLSYATSMENIEEGISRIKKAVKAVKAVKS